MVPQWKTVCPTCRSIFMANIKELREEGVDVENFLKEVGYRSIIMDVPVLKKETRRSRGVEKAPPQIHATSPSEHSSRREETSHSVAVKNGKFNTPSNAAGKFAASSPKLRKETDKPIFQDCIDESFGSEQDLALNVEAGTTSHGNLTSSLAPVSCAVEVRPADQLDSQNEMGSDIAEEPIEAIATNQLEPEYSFMEFSRKFVNGIHRLKPSREHAAGAKDVVRTSSTEALSSKVQSSVERDSPEVTAEHNSSYVLFNLTSSESHAPPGRRQQPRDDDHVTERSGSPFQKQTARKQRKRRRRSTSGSNDSGDEKESTQPAGDEKGHPRDSSPIVFHCKYPGCKAKVLWRRKYGKNRLVRHTRIHWGKKLKKCSYCSFTATHEYKVHDHHKNFHGDKQYKGFISLETKEDMEELVNLWMQCFPEYLMLHVRGRRL